MSLLSEKYCHCGCAFFQSILIVANGDFIREGSLTLFRRSSDLRWMSRSVPESWMDWLMARTATTLLVPRR